MNNEHKPYMPNVAFEMDEFRALAGKARREAARLVVQAEVWEEAANRIEVALRKEQSTAQGKKGDL